jgi:ribosomal protein S18 acetylase RimI-like enzyme
MILLGNMKGQSLFSRTRRYPAIQVRPTTREDGWAVESLLSSSNHNYQALEWWTVQDFLGSPTLLLATDHREQPVGLALAVLGDGPVAWLRAVAVASDECLEALLAAISQAVLAQGSAGLALLGGKNWLLSRLKSCGFRRINRVITLRRRGPRPADTGAPNRGVRAASPADLDAVLAVDHAAFTELWWYDRAVLQHALDQGFFSVAYQDGACVGYQFCTLRQGRGHIVRLATHPQWQRQGIGQRLLSAALTSLEQAGAQSVTVNTQQDNDASLRLYRRFAFQRIGTPWDVWFSASSEWTKDDRRKTVLAA